MKEFRTALRVNLCLVTEKENKMYIIIEHELQPPYLSDKDLYEWRKN